MQSIPFDRNKKRAATVRPWVKMLLRDLRQRLYRALDIQITLTNPLAGRPLALRLLSHRPYIVGMRRRFARIARAADSLIRRGDVVLEVGGHIGYLSQWFTRKVGAEGQVHMFDPAPSLRPLIRENLRGCTQATHINVAVGERVGKTTFYEDLRGGFLSSLRSDHAQKRALAARKGKPDDVAVCDVHELPLDAYVRQHALNPNILRLSVVGGAEEVLRGAGEVLATVRAVIIDLAPDESALCERLIAAGFALFDLQGRAITGGLRKRQTIIARRQ